MAEILGYAVLADQLGLDVFALGEHHSAERAGRLGLPMVLGYIGGTLGHLRQLVDTYRAAGERAGHPDQLKVALSTHFHASADPAKARAVYSYYHEYLRPKRPGGRGFVVSPAAFEAGTGRHGAIMIGSAGEITDKLLGAAKALDLDRIFAQVDWGGLPRSWSGSPSPATPPRSLPPSARRPPRWPRGVRLIG
jgi:alkanesulfonate monooxygenase SsuD/methylene tetrahydromethanopterin reductase-like flavin-dependent oxidoreductase (luciferase family)